MFACLKHLWTSSWVAMETETTEWWREKAQLVTLMSIGWKNKDCAVWSGWHFKKHYWLCEEKCSRLIFRSCTVLHQLCFICNFISCYMTSAVLTKNFIFCVKEIHNITITILVQFCTKIHFKHHVMFDLYCSNPSRIFHAWFLYSSFVIFPEVVLPCYLVWDCQA